MGIINWCCSRDCDRIAAPGFQTIFLSLNFLWWQSSAVGNVAALSAAATGVARTNITRLVSAASHLASPVFYPFRYTFAIIRPACLSMFGTEICAMWIVEGSLSALNRIIIE